MALETATHINDLVITNPDGLDDVSQGDNHIRMVKDVIKRDLPLTQPATALGMSILTSATSDAVRSLLGASNNAFRNRVINGDISIFQRNTGGGQTIVAGAALAYCIDRFYAYCTGANINISQNNNRMDITGASSNTGVGIGTRLQASNTLDLANKNATLSVTLGGTYSGAVNWAVYYANGIDTFGTLASPSRTTISSGTFTAISGTVNVSAIIAIPAAATTGIEVVFSVAALGVATTLTISNVQLERGSIQNSDVVFEVVDTPLQQLRCEYYYQNFNGGNGITGFGVGRQTSTTASRIWFPINTMRVVPTVAFGGAITLDVAGAQTAATLSTVYASKNAIMLDVTHSAIGAAGQGAGLQIPNGYGNYISLSSEL
jgi:hypothetical protein